MTVALTPRARIRVAAGTLRGSCIVGSGNAGCYTDGRGAAPPTGGRPRRVAGPFAGRVGTPDEVPTVAAFLLGPDAALITGADRPCGATARSPTQESHAC